MPTTFIVSLIVSLSLVESPAPAYTLERDLIYGQGYVADTPESTTFRLKDLTCDLYLPTQPAEAPSRPALIFAHGGSFIAGAKENREIESLARYLATRGDIVMNINYRLMKDNPPAAPAPYDISLPRLIHALATDMKTALRYLRANAANYNADPGRIAVGGVSAGAFGALATGLSDEAAFTNDGPDHPVPPENHPEQPSKPNAVVDFCGNASFLYDQYDPNDPPILVVHGTNDQQFGTSFFNALALKNACEKNNIPIVFCPLEGGTHNIWPEEYNGQDIFEITHAFLENHMPATKQSAN